VAEGLAWQWIFWINVPIGPLTIPLVPAKIPESRGAGGALDVPGLVLISGAALGVAWGLVRGNGSGWGSLEVVGSIAIGLALLVAFAAYERRAR
jgi:hypothetical protein